MKTSQYKPGQLVTILDKVYRINKAPWNAKRVCSLCDMKDNEFTIGCFQHCYRRAGSRMPMRCYYEQVGKSEE